MDLSSMTKVELLEKCKELGITKCKSKNKGELIDLINLKIHPKKKVELIIEDDDIGQDIGEDIGQDIGEDKNNEKISDLLKYDKTTKIF